MSNLRTNLRKSNPYYITEFRRKELEYFCRQYGDYKKYLSDIGRHGSSSEWSDPTGDEAVKRVLYEKYIDLIESSARMAGSDIYEYLLKAVTEGLSYPYLLSHYNPPFGKDLFYDRLHKFYYILSSQKRAYVLIE